MLCCWPCKDLNDIDTPSSPSYLGPPARTSRETIYNDLSIQRRPEPPVTRALEEPPEPPLHLTPGESLRKAWHDFRDATPSFLFNYQYVNDSERARLRQDSLSWPREDDFRGSRRRQARDRLSWASLASLGSQHSFSLGLFHWTWRGLHQASSTLSSTQSLPQSAPNFPSTTSLSLKRLSAHRLPQPALPNCTDQASSLSTSAIRPTSGQQTLDDAEPTRSSSLNPERPLRRRQCQAKSHAQAAGPTRDQAAVRSLEAHAHEPALSTANCFTIEEGDEPEPALPPHLHNAPDAPASPIRDRTRVRLVSNGSDTERPSIRLIT